MIDFPTEAYFNRDEPMPRQTRDWSCSACALAWLNRAMQIDRGTSEDTAIDLIGYPTNIYKKWGLSEGSGRRLAELLREDRGAAFYRWSDFWDVYEASERCALLIGGVRWNHWVGVRYAAEGKLHLANSAPGWMEVQEELNDPMFNDLGPFAVVYVPIVWEFPEMGSDQE